ncbi:MAG TPA: hypothetical protein ACFYEF_02385 [Candidatus Wunengus sp. YC63]
MSASLLGILPVCLVAMGITGGLTAYLLCRLSSKSMTRNDVHRG